MSDFIRQTVTSLNASTLTLTHADEFLLLDLLNLFEQAGRTR